MSEYLKVGVPKKMDGTTDTTITLLGVKPGYAHVRYYGEFEGEAPKMNELLSFCDDGTTKVCRHFGGREYKKDGNKFSIILHTD